MFLTKGESKKVRHAIGWNQSKDDDLTVKVTASDPSIVVPAELKLNFEANNLDFQYEIRAGQKEGEFVVTGPMATGTRVRMGRTAVLDTGAMQLVISERRSEPFDLGVFTHCGIDPRRKRYVLIKSRQHFRAGFEPIARHIVLCDGDGVTSSDLKLFTYRNRRRPLYPFEP